MIQQINENIVADFSETLMDAHVDNFHYRVTWSPLDTEACILWFSDENVSSEYEALGRFSHFDRRTILDFITRFTTSADLRREIDLRKFVQKLDTIPTAKLDRIPHLNEDKRRAAFRELYDLDDVVDRIELDRKRRLLAKRFHPDAGGTHTSMTVVNEAYEYFSAQVG